MFTVLFLQVQYDIHPTLKEMENKLSCKKLFEDYVSKWYSSCTATCSKEQISPASKGQEQNTNTSIIRAPSECHKQDPVSVTASTKGEMLLKKSSHFERLAGLLGVHRGDLLSFLASLAAKDGKLEEAVYICR